MGKNPFPLRTLALALVPVGFLGLFFFFPLVSIIQRVFSGQSFVETWSLSDTWEIFWFTLWQAGVSSLLTLIFALPMAFVLGRFRFKGLGIISALLVVPFVLPTLVVASSILALQERLGLRGILDHSIWAILLAHVFFNFALVARIIGNYWAYLDPRPELAARLLGANTFQTFLKITLPRLRPAILSAMGLVFFFSFTSFGVILILGGPSRATLDTEIWRYAFTRIDFETAAALALLQLLVVGIMAFFNVWSSKNVARASAGVENRTAPKSSAQKGILIFALSLTGILICLPLLSMVWESLSPGTQGFGLESYKALFGDTGRITYVFVEPLQAIWNSLAYAISATGISVVIGVTGALFIFSLKGKRGWGVVIEPLFLIPLGISAVILGFGYLISLDEAPLDLRTSWIIVPLAHALIGMPFVLRPVLSQLRSIDERLRWSATTLGANGFDIFRKIDLPIISRSILVGAGFSFAISLGEFGASSFLVRPDRPTIPITIFQLLSRPGNLSYGQAMALSVILMLLLGITIFSIDRLTRLGKLGRAGSKGRAAESAELQIL